MKIQVQSPGGGSPRPFARLSSRPTDRLLTQAPSSPPPAGEPPQEPHDHPDPSDEKGDHVKHGGLGGHIGIEWGEQLARIFSKAKSGIVELKTEAHQTASDAMDAALSPTRHLTATHTTVSMSTGLLLTSGALGLASSGLGLFLLGLGARDLRQGLHHKNYLHAIEGANTALVGVRSLAAGLNLAGHVGHQLPWLASAGHAAHETLMPLGIVHGSVDTAIGLYETVQGVRQRDFEQFSSGILGMGTGGALVAAAAGGGIPALATAGAFLVGKVAHNIYYADKR